MDEPLSERFASAHSRVVDLDGAPAYSLYELDPAPEDLAVEFLAAVTLPPQGLRLRVRGGRLSVGGTKAHDVVLWRETAPRLVKVAVLRDSPADPTLMVWNVWKGAQGVIQAWVGNAAMRVDRSADGAELLLSCSDGIGAATFDDLTVRLVTR